MGSAAMDQMGEIAIRYSDSSAASGDYPSIYYAGQTAGDHRGTTETEALIKPEHGLTTGYGRSLGRLLAWLSMARTLARSGTRPVLPGYRKVQLGHVARFAHIPEVLLESERSWRGG
jgi:hypothetical protein